VLEERVGCEERWRQDVAQIISQRQGICNQLSKPTWLSGCIRARNAQAQRRSLVVASDAERYEPILKANIPLSSMLHELSHKTPNTHACTE
jgi:hypothetical protein